MTEKHAKEEAETNPKQTQNKPLKMNRNATEASRNERTRARGNQAQRDPEKAMGRAREGTMASRKGKAEGTQKKQTPNFEGNAKGPKPGKNLWGDIVLWEAAPPGFDGLGWGAWPLEKFPSGRWVPSGWWWQGVKRAFLRAFSSSKSKKARCYRGF